MIGSGHTSDCLREWHEFSKPINKCTCSNGKLKANIDYFRHSSENYSIGKG